MKNKVNICNNGKTTCIPYQKERNQTRNMLNLKSKIAILAICSASFSSCRTRTLSEEDTFLARESNIKIIPQSELAKNAIKVSDAFYQDSKNSFGNKKGEFAFATLKQVVDEIENHLISQFGGLPAEYESRLNALRRNKYEYREVVSFVYEYTYKLSFKPGEESNDDLNTRRRNAINKFLGMSVEWGRIAYLPSLGDFNLDTLIQLRAFPILPLPVVTTETEFLGKTYKPGELMFLFTTYANTASESDMKSYLTAALKNKMMDSQELSLTYYERDLAMKELLQRTNVSATKYPNISSDMCKKYLFDIFYKGIYSNKSIFKSTATASFHKESLTKLLTENSDSQLLAPLVSQFDIAEKDKTRLAKQAAEMLEWIRESVAAINF